MLWPCSLARRRNLSFACLGAAELLVLKGDKREGSNQRGVWPSRVMLLSAGVDRMPRHHFFLELVS
jgi:hypothetical protein